MIQLKQPLFQWHVDQEIFLKFLSTSSILAIITKAWGKVQEDVAFRILLEGFNLLLFLT